MPAPPLVDGRRWVENGLWPVYAETNDPGGGDRLALVEQEPQTHSAANQAEFPGCPVCLPNRAAACFPASRTPGAAVDQRRVARICRCFMRYRWLGRHQLIKLSVWRAPPMQTNRPWPCQSH